VVKEVKVMYDGTGGIGSIGDVRGYRLYRKKK